MSKRDPVLWRLRRENAEETLKVRGGPGVRLHGGPADGWYVADNAPMLIAQERWYDFAPEWVHDKFRRGRYVTVDRMEDDARDAEWHVTD
jgi:hypothetical protein